MGDANLKLKVIFGAIDRMSGVMRRVESRSRVMARVMGGGLTTITRLTGHAVAGLRRIGTIAAAAGLAVGAVITKIAQTGISYEQAITDVGAVMRKTREEIKPLDLLAQRLGKTTKFTATEAASGMQLLARAGFSVEQNMAAVPGVLAAAAASGDDLATTADNVIGVLKGMGLAEEKAGYVADVLTVASTKTNSTIGSLAESMKNVAATARQLGIPLKDTVAAVALLQDVGLDASESGSSLARMLVKLSAPSAKAAATFKKFGVAFQTAEGKALPFEQILANVGIAVNKAGGNMQQIAMIAEAVGMRGQKAAINLQEMARSGKFKKLTDELAKVNGAAEDVANKRMDTTQGAITLLKSAVDGLKVKLFETEGGPLRKIVERTTKWVSANEDLITQDVSKFIDKLKPFADIFGKGFLDTFKGIVGGFKTMWEAFGGAGGSNALLKELAKNLGIIAAVVAGAIIAFGALVAAVTVGVSAVVSGFKSGFGAIIEGIGGLISAITETWDNIKAIWDAGGLSLIDKMGKIAYEVVRGFIKGLKAGWELLRASTVDFGKNILKGLKKGLGISSPSRPAEEIALQTGAGYERGIIKSIPRIEAALQRMAVLPSVAAANTQFPEARHLRLLRTGARDTSERSGRGGEAPELERPPLFSVRGMQISKSISEKTTTSRGELIIHDKSDRAELVKDPKSPNVRIKLKRTGTF